MTDQHFNNQIRQSRLSACADYNPNHFKFYRATPANQRHLSFEKGGAFNRTLYFLFWVFMISWALGAGYYVWRFF